LAIFEDPMIVVGFKFVDGDAFLLSRFFGDPTIIFGTIGWAMFFFNLKLGSYLIFSNGWGLFSNFDIS